MRSVRVNDETKFINFIIWELKFKTKTKDILKTRIEQVGFSDPLMIH